MTFPNKFLSLSAQNEPIFRLDCLWNASKCISRDIQIQDTVSSTEYVSFCLTQAYSRQHIAKATTKKKKKSSKTAINHRKIMQFKNHIKNTASKMWNIFVHLKISILEKCQFASISVLFFSDQKKKKNQNVNNNKHIPSNSSNVQFQNLMWYQRKRIKIQFQSRRHFSWANIDRKALYASRTTAKSKYGGQNSCRQKHNNNDKTKNK